MFKCLLEQLLNESKKFSALSASSRLYRQTIWVLEFLARGKFLDVVSELMEDPIHTVRGCTPANRLGVNAVKTELDYSGTDRKEIQLYDKPQYLGVTLKKKLKLS